MNQTPLFMFFLRCDLIAQKLFSPQLIPFGLTACLLSIFIAIFIAKGVTMSFGHIVVGKSAAMPAKAISHRNIVNDDALRRLPRAEECPIVGFPCPLGSHPILLENGYQ